MQKEKGTGREGAPFKEGREGGRGGVREGGDKTMHVGRCRKLWLSEERQGSSNVDVPSWGISTGSSRSAYEMLGRNSVRH